MPLSAEAEALRDRFVEVLLAAARPLQDGPDPEVALAALADAARVVGERFRLELAELRQEQAD